MAQAGFHLAQVNIAKFSSPPESPQNADFFANLERINALADAAEGFVWRLVGEGDNATDIKAFDDREMIINMSLWEGLPALAAFVYRSGHVDIMRRRREWFAPLDVFQALWWLPVGDLPSLEDARERLDHIAKHGATAHAFTFSQPFPAPGSDKISSVLEMCA